MPERDAHARRRAHFWGLQAETLAALWLQAQLYRVLARNYRIQGGEIDIIARRGRTIVFVEVKARADLEAAALALTPRKEKRVARAANRWLAAHPWAAGCSWRADAVLIAPRRLPRHIENAFALDFS
jgi:putative endonuclease